MDPYTLHQMQQAGAFEDPAPAAPADLLELLLDRFLETEYGRRAVQSPQCRDVLAQFLGHGREYLNANPAVSYGMLDGGMTVVLRDGESVPLARPQGDEAPARPSPTYAVTRPRETRLKGMRGGEDDSIGITGRGRR